MPAPRKYPNELRERAIRLVREARQEEPELSLTAAVNRIGPRVGVNVDTLRGWCKQSEVDAGRRPGVTTADAARLRELEREVRELKRANEILLAASSFFARELDPRLPWCRVHRRPQDQVRGRADLPCAQRARVPDRPVYLLRRAEPGAVRAGVPGRAGPGRDRACPPGCARRPVRTAQDLPPAPPGGCAGRRAAGADVHDRTADA